MVKRLGMLALGVFALVALSAGSAHAQAKCQSAKIKASGKKASCLLGVHSKAVSKNLAPDGAKLAACVAKFNAAFTKAELGTCSTTSDASAIESMVDSFVNSTVADVAGPAPAPSKCQAAKVKAAGKKASCLLGAEAGGVSKGVPADPAKVTACKAKFSAAATKADTGTTCGVTAGDGNVIEANVDAFADGIACKLDPGTACTCGSPAPARASFTTSVGAGTCGATQNDGGGTIASLGCNTLYTGGGGAAVPPATVPDYGSTLTNVSCCRNKFIALSATTSAQTGSNLNCSDVNCRYGAPLPIISGTSVCVINRVAQAAAGHAYCDVGSETLNIPLFADVYLTLDVLPKRCDAGSPSPGLACFTDANCGGGVGSCASDPAVEPCPICNPSTLVCNGGPNNGLTCVPGTLLAPGAQFPTSHDCPPPGSPLGILPIPYLLTTGSVTKTSVNLPSQNRVFCGFCGDPASADFKNPPTACVSDADCAAFLTQCSGGPCTACKQHTGGAFATLGVRTITENGSPAGPIATGGAPAAATLASVFCIPPTFNVVIDGVGDLPGPGAVSLQGTLQLLP